MKKLCLLLLILMFLLTACGPSVEDRIADYANIPITISGLGEDFTITPKELSALKLETVDASARSDSFQITGPSLETFLKHYGYSISDIAKVRFVCSDDYKVVLAKQSLENYDIILGIAEADAPLSEKRRPLRMIIPGQDSAKWAYGVVRIELVVENAS